MDLIEWINTINKCQQLMQDYKPKYKETLFQERLNEADGNRLKILGHTPSHN